MGNSRSDTIGTVDGSRVKNGLLCVTYVKQLVYLRVSLPPWSERPGALKVVRSA